ncbi:FecCD family ABC transporter permease [Paenibacillus lutimineralis]|uniref:Iron ABC transporter permease n=1 Tax=Paenibacillus lutimineralis TaxID=2707005 RepID=A0A3S9V2B8_9BACL|nr:iron ABC transporter permease [Paenibacillus lutimineralis]AZS16752.1 iron ABC transporter permease [Paenibacillus lutimineralis]
MNSGRIASRYRALVLILFFVMVAVAMMCSVLFGVTQISLHNVIESYTAFNGSNEHLIIQHTRVPRALIAAAVGAGLAVAGAYMQGLTRNPLASPSILGVNAGAAFFVVTAYALVSDISYNVLTWVAFFGAAVAVAVVYGLGSLGRDGMTPIKITLAGSAMTAFFSSLTQGIQLTSGKAFEQTLFWLVGSVADRELSMLQAVAPYMLAALVVALLLAGQMNVLSMGDDVATGLGQRTWMIKIVAVIVILLLAGGSVAVAGPIAFVGIIIPHFARFLVGTDYKWVIPYSIALGALLLLIADIGARFIVMPKEVPVGVMTAIVGVPFFVYVARKGGNGK